MNPAGATLPVVTDPEAVAAAAAAYGLYAAAFREPAPVPPPPDLLRAVYARFPGGAALVLPPAPPADTEGAWRKLFGHNLSPDCPPYETQFGRTGVFRQAQDLADLAGFYRAFGVEAAGGERRPDHLPVELEFLSLLARKEAMALGSGEADRAALCRAARARFLREHLGRWAGGFAAALTHKAPDSYWAAVAVAMARFVDADARALSAEPAPEEIANEIRADLGGDCGDCPAVFGLILAAVLALAGPGRAADVRVAPVGVRQTVSADPADTAWAAVAAVTVPLMPQIVAPPGGGGAVASVDVKALRTPGAVLFRLEWADTEAQDDASAPERFADAAALEFPANPGPLPSPFMGDRDRPVAIWRWSASSQKDADGGWRDARVARPRTAIDYYPNDDPTFRAGEAAGNPLSTRTRTGAVELLMASGFGTLAFQKTQPLSGRGTWTAGRWAVVLAAPAVAAGPLAGKADVPFAVAVWNGGDRERDGIKSVSVWQTVAGTGGAAVAAAVPVARGRRVFERYGCPTCHGRDAKGGMKNPNAQTNPIPPLHKVKAGFTKEEVLAVIMKGREPARVDPAGPPAAYRMNAWAAVLGTEESDDLVEYLFSLQPKPTAGEDF